jgi:hypothetical protein
MKTSEYYDKHPNAKAKKDAYRKKYNKKPEQIKKRTELNKINRDRGTYGNFDGLDASHTKNGIVMKKASVNRGGKDMPGDRRARPEQTITNTEYIYRLLKRNK